MPEAIKFRKENTRPRDFMRSPTEPFRLPIGVHALLQEEAINHLARTNPLVRTAARLYGKDTAPVLQVGSDIEIILFSGDSTPHRDKELDRSDNPNYFQTHIDNVQRFAERIGKPSDKGGLRDVLYNDGDFKAGKITLEIRTQPADASGYMTAMGIIQQWFQRTTPIFNIRPVIDSQHLHLSLYDQNEGANPLIDFALKGAIRKGIVDIYHRAMPLLRLPETVEAKKVTEMGKTQVGIKTKIGTGPKRLEGRMTNNEYASDHHINLLFHLIGIKRGLQYSEDHSAIDKDYPLQETDFPKGAFFYMGEGYTNFNDSLQRITEDQVLQQELPAELLRGLQDVVGQYWDISAGKMSASEARERAYDRVVLGIPLKKPASEPPLQSEVVFSSL